MREAGTVRTVHPADAPAALRPLLTGATVPGRVLGVFPQAVYVLAEGVRHPSIGDASAPSPVVALVTSDGVRQPNALVLRATAASAPFGQLTVGLPAVVGTGGVAIGANGAGLHVRAARWSDRRPRVGSVDPAVLLTSTAVLTRARSGGRVDVELESRVRALGSALQRGLPARVASAGRALVGFGRGLTPSGDDVLAGFLAGVHAFTRGPVPAPALDRLVVALWAAVAHDLSDRTTALSAALLAHARNNEMAAPAADLATAMVAGRGLEQAHRALLAVGHSSGADLARGLELAGATVTCFLSRTPHHATTDHAGAR